MQENWTLEVSFYDGCISEISERFDFIYYNPFNLKI